MILQARDRDLRISARLLSFVDPASAHYRYRVNGYDERWVEEGASGERVISRLPPGITASTCRRVPAMATGWPHQRCKWKSGRPGG